jgi:hypothetical protein
MATYMGIECPTNSLTPRYPKNPFELGSFIGGFDMCLPFCLANLIVNVFRKCDEDMCV